MAEILQNNEISNSPIDNALDNLSEFVDIGIEKLWDVFSLLSKEKTKECTDIIDNICKNDLWVIKNRNT